MQVRKIPIHYARVNMMIANNIYDHTGILLMTKNSSLNATIIIKLKLHGISQIDVYDDSETLEMPADEQSTYLKRIRHTEAFKRFEDTFSKAIDVFREDINEVILNNKELDITQLTKEVYHLLVKDLSGINMLDMLLCMRDYDELTYVHSVNVGLICHMIGRWLNFSEADKYLLSMCGLLHDVGKLCIPKTLIAKPSKLTSEEFNTMKTHAYRGYELLKNQNIDERIKLVTLMHHEKCDGTGYPSGLKNTQIIEFAKIVAIADVYDAMTSNRVYRQGICPFDVIAVFEEEGFDKYDPKYLLPFLEHIAQSYINYDVQLSNEEKGKVIMINKAALSKPVVQVAHEFIDLSKEHSMRICAIL